MRRLLVLLSDLIRTLALPLCVYAFVHQSLLHQQHKQRRFFSDLLPSGFNRIRQIIIIIIIVLVGNTKVSTEAIATLKHQLLLT